MKQRKDPAPAGPFFFAPKGFPGSKKPAVLSGGLCLKLNQVAGTAVGAAPAEAFFSFSMALMRFLI